MLLVSSDRLLSGTSLKNLHHLCDSFFNPHVKCVTKSSQPVSLDSNPLCCSPFHCFSSGPLCPFSRISIPAQWCPCHHPHSALHIYCHSHHCSIATTSLSSSKLVLMPYCLHLESRFLSLVIIVGSQPYFLFICPIP